MSGFKKRYNNMGTRNSEAISIKQGLNDLFKHYKLTGKLREKSIVHSWTRIMGKSIAIRTSKVYMKDKTLFVHLTSAPLKNELSMSKDKILDMFEQEHGTGIIDDIRFN